MNLELKLKIVASFLTCLITGCIEGGTHGSIKAYQYPISKFLLDSAVQKTLALNPNIRQDTIADYYNDVHKYVTIEIKQPDGKYEYIFRYAGDTTYWDTSHNLSDLFICYAHDPQGNGGSEGNGGVTWHDWVLKRKLIRPFETEFISKLDSVLGMKHTNPD